MQYRKYRRHELGSIAPPHAHLNIANATASLSTALTMPEQRLLTPLLKHPSGYRGGRSKILGGFGVKREDLTSKGQEKLHVIPGDAIALRCVSPKIATAVHCTVVVGVVAVVPQLSQ